MAAKYDEVYPIGCSDERRRRGVPRRVSEQKCVSVPLNYLSAPEGKGQKAMDLLAQLYCCEAAEQRDREGFLEHERL
jgi:hypothetical protein